MVQTVVFLSATTGVPKDHRTLFMGDNKQGDVMAADIVTYLEKKRRNCDRPNMLKMVVLGCKNRSGYCLVQKLVKSKKSKDAETSEHENLTVSQWIFTPGGRRLLTPLNKKPVSVEIWEFPDIKVTSAILPCFLTLNSLYLIMHDVGSYGSNLHAVSEKISSIEACVLRPHIIVVCTYIDTAERNRLDSEIKAKAVEKEFFNTIFVSVTFGSNESVEMLRQEISAVWETMRDAAYERAHNLHERQVPSKFFDVTKKVKQLKSNICTMEEFLQNVDCTKKDLEDGIDKHLKLHEFLLQIGAMLHYDIQMEKLSEFVILDPAWLFEVLCKFLKSLTKRRHNIAQLPIGTVQRQVQSMLPHEDYFPPFLKILEAFNIGVRIHDGQGKEILLIPSLLSKRPPQFQLDTERDGVQAARLYRLPAISPALWSHVISQLSSAFERLSTTKWKLGERSSLPGGTFDKTKSFRMTCKPSMQGLHVTNKNKQYWRTGIMINHDHGYVVVEEVECTSSSSPGKVESAILVTVQTKMSDDGHDEEDQRMENLKRLSVIGIVRDELEEVLELFNPKFRDPSEMQFKPYALCPLCYKITPGSGSIDVSNLHFSVRDCAQMVLFRDTILCSRGPVLLEQLVPEFLFLELPSQMCLSHNDIELFDEKLGHGMAGTVTKGKYKGTEVAIKVFHKPTLEPPSLRDVMYPNIGDVSAEHRNSRIRLDQLETEQSKISSAFSEVRREVGILSKLSHKCIVTFIGVCVQPHLLLVMELAAHGSLRSELKKRSETHHGQQHTENTLISQMVFSKDLTYRMILQIGCGLAYLHKNNIIYRDLKPDNILVISLEVEDPINVKLSDYGISKFGTLQGLSGMFGTVGYMAPEVMSKQVYTEKVDIYSFAIVMLEILTGIPPLEQDQRPLVSLMTGDSSTPVHIQGHKIQCNFPCLEILMSECWSPWMGDRPSAEEVVTKMKAEHFLLLHSCIWLEDNNPKLEVTCIYACETAGRWNVWISESGPGSHRFFSVYDVESSCFTVNRKPLPGPRVISMTKVGVRIWLACQDVDTLQIVVRGHQNKFDIVPGETLEAKPTKLLHHSFEASEVGEGFIIAGLANGSVTAYHFKNAHRTTVKTVTSIELNSSFEIACMCSVNPSLVAVGCGMKVFFLNVGFYNAEKTDGSSKQILTVPELINFGSVSLNDILDHHEPVDSMAAEGNSVWCSLENCPYMIQIDTDHKKIMHILTLSWDPTCDTVRLEEKGETSADPHSRQVAVEIGQGLAASEDGHEVRRSDVSHNSDVIEISENQNMAYQQGFKKCATLPGHRESAAVSFEEVVCDKQALSDEDGETDEESARTVYYMIEPGMFSAPKDETRLSRSVDISRTPPVPPRAPFSRRAIREKARSMPDLQLPPPLPKRKSHREKDLAVTSIALSSDVLIVGTNCGGCLFIPFTYINTSDKAGIIHPLPHQYPVLRHPESNAETCGRKRSYTSNSLSQVSVQSQPQTSTGSISALTLANHRLISLHSVCDQVCRRRQSSRDTYDDRRQASLFPAEVAERLNSLNISEDDFIHENAENPSEVFLDPARPVSGISQQSLLSRVDQLQLTEVADIAIWDEISCQRLATVQAYGESMSV